MRDALTPPLPGTLYHVSNPWYVFFTPKEVLFQTFEFRHNLRLVEDIIGIFPWWNSRREAVNHDDRRQPP